MILYFSKMPKSYFIDTLILYLILYFAIDTLLYFILLFFYYFLLFYIMLYINISKKIRSRLRRSHLKVNFNFGDLFCTTPINLNFRRSVCKMLLAFWMERGTESEVSKNVPYYTQICLHFHRNA